MNEVMVGELREFTEGGYRVLRVEDIRVRHLPPGRPARRLRESLSARRRPGLSGQGDPARRGRARAGPDQSRPALLLPAQHRVPMARLGVRPRDRPPLRRSEIPPAAGRCAGARQSRLCDAAGPRVGWAKARSGIYRVGKIVRAPCRPNSGLPEFGTLEWPKSDISDFGCRTGMADDFAHPTTTRMTASPPRAEHRALRQRAHAAAARRRVVPQGIKLVPTMVHPSEMFWRQLRFAEFDISEMSMSSLIISISRGERSWVAIPVFTMRKFFHTSIIVRTDAGITAPADLRGKRIGVPEYQQTWAIWSRGVLRARIRRACARHRMVHGAQSRQEPRRRHRLYRPAGVRVNQIPPTDEYRRDARARRARRRAALSGRQTTWSIAAPSMSRR